MVDESPTADRLRIRPSIEQEAVTDADTILDLQLAMNNAYDDGAFGYVIDYRAAPEVSLTAEQAAWTEAHLRAAGLRA